MVKPKWNRTCSRLTNHTDAPFVCRIGCYRELTLPERALSDKVYPSDDYNVTVELCAEFGSSTPIVYQ